MRIVYWFAKATNKQSEYVIIFAFPLKQWLQEPTLVLRYTHNACRDI